MKIVIASSEAVPFSKTGGLADVASALAKAHDANGHDVWLFLPYYPQIHAKSRIKLPTAEETGLEIELTWGAKTTKTERGRILSSTLPGTNVSVIFIQQDKYFDRSGLYLDEYGDFGDNCERFVFFSRMVMETVRRMLIKPDVIHSNDWQTGLIPALLQLEYQGKSGFEKTGSLFTIHNLAYQGSFPSSDMDLTGIGWEHYNWQEMEAYGRLNLLKTGIVFSDIVTTVSPTYAREITTAAGGCGLQGALTARRADLIGILNGVDCEIWNPASDSSIAQQFNAANVHAGKSACKTCLQQEFNLPVSNDIPLFGMISRMADQKGFDLIEQSAEELLNSEDFQLCFLGTGEPRYQDFLTHLAHRYPQQVATYIGFDEQLAHRIEAGADIFLMPSRYEPCGLNQMYSLIYGTLPLVRRVGGLADSVVDYSPETLANRTANGFHFLEYDSLAFTQRMRDVISLYQDQTVWSQLVQQAMQTDFSWEKSAEQYILAYQRTQTK